MIDDDDVTMVALFWPIFGPISAVIGILLVIFLACEAEKNETEQA